MQNLIIKCKDKHELKTVIATGYVSENEEEEDNIKENAELSCGTKYMLFDKLIYSWLYSWMINNFSHCFGWSPSLYKICKYKRHKL